MGSSTRFERELASQQPCYSARLVMPFVRQLRHYPDFPPDGLDALEALGPDERLPIAHVHELLQAAMEKTGDGDLGLKAARQILPGDHGALDYCARFASTWREALQSVGRYMRLVNDALLFSLRTEGEHALIQMDSSVPLPRVAADFQAAAFHVSGSYIWSSVDAASAQHLQGSSPPAIPARPELEALFMHARPADISEYERTFVGCRLHFDAPWSGFRMPIATLDSPVQSADPKLHELIRQHADLLLAELPRAKSVTEAVRELVTQDLAGGTPSVSSIAHKLTMSPRTLARRLEQENTTFKLLIADLRRRLALRYVASSDMALAEIAFLLGFSQSAAFHRAFKRWTRQTPREYRRTHRATPKVSTQSAPR